MKPRFARTSILLLGTAACACSSLVGTDPSCLAVLELDGVRYGESEIQTPLESDIDPQAYAAVTRALACLDEPGLMGQGGDVSAPAAASGLPPRSADSNFLPLGTTLHRIAGFDPTERLAYWSSSYEIWRVVTALSGT